MARNTQKGEKRLQTTWIKPPTPRQFKQFRKQIGYSATAMGRALGISRSYVKHIEGGSLPIRQRVARAFADLQARFAGKPSQRDPVIISRFAMPAEVRLLAKPRKCRGHRRWHIFRTPYQIYCGKECQKLWGKTKRRKAQPRGGAGTGTNAKGAARNSLTLPTPAPVKRSADTARSGGKNGSHPTS